MLRLLLELASADLTPYAAIGTRYVGNDLSASSEMLVRGVASLVPLISESMMSVRECLIL